MSDWTKIAIEVMKSIMKPGYLYGVSEDGELYAVEAEMPKPGETAVVRFYMPETENLEEVEL